jgi:hypothetical protein
VAGAVRAGAAPAAPSLASPPPPAPDTGPVDLALLDALEAGPAPAHVADGGRGAAALSADAVALLRGLVHQRLWPRVAALWTAGAQQESAAQALEGVYDRLEDVERAFDPAETGVLDLVASLMRLAEERLAAAGEHAEAVCLQVLGACGLAISVLEAVPSSFPAELSESKWSLAVCH